MATYHIDPLNGNDANDGGGWTKLLLANGVGAQPVADETVTGAGGATGYVIKITGTWATAPTVYLYGRNATAFANGEAITFSGGGSATNGQGTPYTDVVCSFKTIKKTFAAADIIKVAKSPETAGAGTVTATTGSVSVATTNDLSSVCPQYTAIRIGGDNTLYMVRSITPSVITLNRPYRGTTGAGKGLTYFASLPTSAQDDWKPTAIVGTLANPITLTGGVNKATNSQDGFTVLYGNGAYLIIEGTWTYVNMTNVATLYHVFPWNATMTTCTIGNCFAFRTSQFSNGASWIRCVVNGFIFEYTQAFENTSLIGCTLNDIESGYNSVLYLNNGVANTDFYRFKNAGFSGQYAVQIGGQINNCKFIDSKFDELLSGCTALRTYNLARGMALDVTLRKPIFGQGTVLAVDYNGVFHGAIKMECVNQSATDHRVYYGMMEDINNGKYYLVQSDYSIGKTAAPSAKVSLFQSVNPQSVKHYIPVDAGVAKTISVWMFKNSNPISTATLNAAGSGYAVGDLISVTQAGAGSSVLQVLTLSGSGVATFAVLSGGYNHSVANTLNTTTLTGAGSGCKINITAVGTGYGSATLPIMRLWWTTGTAPNLVTNSYDVTMPDTNNAWQQLSHAVTLSIQGAVIMELIFQSANAGAIVWYDDLGVA